MKMALRRWFYRAAAKRANKRCPTNRRGGAGRCVGGAMAMRAMPKLRIRSLQQANPRMSRKLQPKPQLKPQLKHQLK